MAQPAACPGQASGVQCTEPSTEVPTLPDRLTYLLRAKGKLMLDFGPDLCGDPTFSMEREWLVTNGLGGYASGTVAGALTRRYKSLLIAALQPPVVRTLLVTKL